jgi:hypothetical protein
MSEPEVTIAGKLCARSPKKLYIKDNECEQTVGTRVVSAWRLTLVCQWLVK